MNINILQTKRMMSLRQLCIIILSLFVLECSIPSDSNEEKTIQLLLQGSGVWAEDVGSSLWAWNFHFHPKGRMIYHFAGEGGWEVVGKYTVKNGQVSIEVTGENESDLKIIRKHTCSLKTDSKSVKYSLKLDCDGKSYYGISHAPPSDVRQYRGIKVLPLRIENPRILGRTEFKAMPSLNTRNISCVFRLLDGVHEKMQKTAHILPNTRITIIGRTLEKSQIGKSYSYWYLIDVHYSMADDESCESDRGWIFGANVVL